MKEFFKKLVVTILFLEAKIVLKKYNPKIIAITGSVGKTSTKDAIYTALAGEFHVRKTAKSYNSDIGIPLTILGLPNAWNDPKKWLTNLWKGFLLCVKKTDYPAYLVLEIGADHPGEIERVVRWIHPDISVITRIGDVPVHVEFYKSVKEVIREKSFLARGLKPEGTLILNADDEDVMSFKEFTKAKVMTYGIDSSADIHGTYIAPTYDGEKLSGMSFRAEADGSSMPVLLASILGRQHVYPVLAAFAVAKVLGLNLLTISEAFAKHDYPKGRMNVIEGKENSVIIDDTYNSSPVALEEAFLFLSEVKAKRKIAVVGDMLELGRFSADEHMRLGIASAKIFDVIIPVGLRAKGFGQGAESVLSKKGKKREVVYFDDSVSAGNYVKGILEEGDLVFVKGSQGVRMERTVEKLLAHPEKKKSLLVRQDEEWLARE